MTILFFISTISFFIWSIRNVLFWVSRWQLKEYQLDRFLSYLKEAEQGKKLFFHPLSIAKWLLLLCYGIVVFYPQTTSLYVLIITGVFISQAVQVKKEVLSHRLKRPILTLKSVAIVASGLFFVAVGFFNPLVDWFVWLLILDKATFVFIAVVVFATLFPTELYRDYITEKAMKKRQKYKNLIVIGVTGSYGKSSTKEYIAQILSKKFHVLKTKGSNNTPVGVSKTILSELTQDTEILIAEVAGYRTGNIAKTCQIIKPTIGVLTGISNQHISLFGSLQNIMQGKYELIESLPKNGLAIFNGNSEHIYPLYSKTRKQETILYASEKTPISSHVTASHIAVGKESVSFVVTIGEKRFELKAPLVGKQVVENILPAVYLADKLGMSKAQIAEAVAALMPLPKTMALVVENDVVLVDDTFNASPESVATALEYLGIYKKKKYIVLMPLLELGKEAGKEHYRIGLEISKICDVAYVTNKNFYPELQKGMLDGNVQSSLQYKRIEDIAQDIKGIAKKGDVVLFEGKEAGNVLRQVKNLL